MRAPGSSGNLLYIGAMFHDIGLVEGHRSAHDRFEVYGANAAWQFLAAHGVTGDALRIVWDSIALHTTPGIPQRKEPEVALVTAGVELDVLGSATTTSPPRTVRRSSPRTRGSISRSRSSRPSQTGWRTGPRPCSAP
jgi:hypothetical protein